VYTETGWAAYAKKLGHTLPEGFEDFDGFNASVSYASLLIRESIEKKTEYKKEAIQLLRKIIKEMFIVAQTYSEFTNTHLPIHLNHPALQKSNLERVSEEYANAMVERKPVTSNFALHNIDFKNFEKFGCFFYKDVKTKTCTREFKDKVLSFLNWKKDVRYKINYLKGWGICIKGSPSSAELNYIAKQNRKNLPLTYKKNKSEAFVTSNRKFLRKIIEKAYPDIDKRILDWIYSEKIEYKAPIFVIPLYAYKPTGDSRPDRGLLPMLCALFPSLATKENILVIIYSKHTPSKWEELIINEENELWNTISKLAGCIIVDKTKNGKLLT